MNEIVYMILAFIGGLLLGTIFFGGLWFTVRKLVISKIPALWFLGSFILRVSITLIGFYYISTGSWQRLLICVAGFIIARFAVIHFTKLSEEKQVLLKKEISHET
jgi:F1F0 ATPase subunit 2